MELEADVQINGRASRPLKPSASRLVLPAPGAPPPTGALPFSLQARTQSLVKLTRSEEGDREF